MLSRLQIKSIQKMWLNICTVNLPRILLGISAVQITDPNVVFNIWSHIIFLTKNSLHTPILFEALGSRGGDPYHTVQILYESGVRIKIRGSGFKNLYPHSFALLLIQFGDPDHFRLDPVLYAFRVLKIFLLVWIRGSGPGFAPHSAALFKDLPFLVWIWTFQDFWTFFKRYGKQLKRWDADPDPWVRICTSAFALVPYKYANTVWHQTTNPVLKPDLHVVPDRHASGFLVFSTWKAAEWPDSSQILESGPSRTDSRSSRHRMRTHMMTMTTWNSPGGQRPVPLSGQKLPGTLPVWSCWKSLKI